VFKKNGVEARDPEKTVPKKRGAEGGKREGIGEKREPNSTWKKKLGKRPL